MRVILRLVLSIFIIAFLDLPLNSLYLLLLVKFLVKPLQSVTEGGSGYVEEYDDLITH
jgi:hypothetical protein